MNRYKYNAFNRSGEKVNGKVLALTKVKAVEELNMDNLVVSSIKEDTLYNSYSVIFDKYEELKKVNDQNIILFLVQLESLLKTGLNIVQASDIILELFEKDKHFHKILTHVFSNIKKGETFSESLELYPNVFPEIMISMISVGEQVGDLESVVSELVIFYETKTRNSKQIKSMLVYPLFVLSISVVAMFILLYFVIPEFVKMYKTPEENLPQITRFFIGLSDGFRSNWLLVITAMIVFIVGISFLVKLPRVKKWTDSLLLKIPLTKHLTINSNLIYISSSLSLMFEKAYDKLKALDLIKNNVRNAVYRDYVYLMFINIYNGNKLLDDFEETEHLPTFFRQMIYIGEESSSLAPLLQKSAEYYQERLDRYISSLKSIIEPGLIILILLIILPIILAVVIPMFDVMNRLG